MALNIYHWVEESSFPLQWIQRVGLPMRFHRQTYGNIGASRTHPFPERHWMPYTVSANGKVTKQILAKAIKNVKWKFPWERVPLYPTNSGWQLVTGTIWLPYVSRAERRNVYPCSFHHYNNMSKEPPLSRKAHRNTKKYIKKIKQPRSTRHHPWKTRGTGRAAHRARFALPPVGWTPSPAAIDAKKTHLFLSYKADKWFAKVFCPSWCFLIIQAQFG